MQRSFPLSSNFEGILDYFGWLIDKEDIDRNETTVKNGSSQRRKISVEAFDESKMFVVLKKFVRKEF